MKDFKDNCLLAAGILIPCSACVIAWGIDGLMEGTAWPLRGAMMAAVLGLGAGWFGLLRHRAKAAREAVQQHLQALCQVDLCDLSLDGGPEAPPPLPGDNPWSQIAQRVRTTVEQCRQRTRELKHTRTAWEIRCRRATAECRRIKAILSGLSDPILAVDDFDELLLANAAAEQLFGFDAETAEQRSIAQLVRCEKLVELLRSTRQRKIAASRSDEIEIAEDRDQPLWYRVNVSKLQAPGEEDDSSQTSCHGAVAVLRDVGQEKALQKRNAEFVSAVSHEMKTPLAGIKAYVELLVDGDAEDEETREEFLRVINSQADRLQRLVENMLNLARIEAGVVNVTKKARSLNELLEEAAHVVQPAAEAKRIELVTDLSPLYLGVLADRDMLLQSAINLLSNAIKYTPEGGRVTLRSRLAGDEVAFEVEDTGVGLSEEDCQRVFEKFYRVKKDKTMASGTGLGLPLAKHIVEDVHGGRLEVQSAVGTGSTFSVTLPNAGQMAHCT
jgi:two-component system phosphate regulon sensor histidine kinase PhoR